MTDSVRRIVVASKNPVKAEAAMRGFERMFPDASFELEQVSVESGVSDQPMNDGETLVGATRRAESARLELPEAHYWIGIEGGIEDSDDGMMAFAWIVVIAVERSGRARTGGFFLPERIAELIRDGVELGRADDIVFDRQNSKQKEGAIGLLTANAMNRRELYEQAVMLALVSLKNPELYPHFTDP